MEHAIFATNITSSEIHRKDTSVMKRVKDDKYIRAVKQIAKSNSHSKYFPKFFGL